MDLVILLWLSQTMILKGNSLSKEKCRKNHFSQRRSRISPRKKQFSRRKSPFPPREIAIFPLKNPSRSPGKVLNPQAESRLVPKQLYMGKSSFRDILAEFLEEKNENSPLETPAHGTQKRFQPEPSPLLQWKTVDLKQIKKNGYPPPTPRKITPVREEKPAAAKVEEKIFALSALPSIDQDAAGTLIHLGAIELKTGISLGRVKKAHRRLVKALHPDLILETLSPNEKMRRREQFLMLQAAYESLSRSLKNMEFNDSACGNESASASTSPRQDAA